MLLRVRIPLVLAIIMILWIHPQVAVAQETQPIRILSSTTENDFPDRMRFRIHVEADRPITGITLYFKVQGDLSLTRQPIEFESSTMVITSYTWDTSQITVAPSSPILFYWRVEDEQGNQLTTPEELVYYDDLTFPWREISDPELIVRWYEGPDSFGQLIYDTARQSLTMMEEQTAEELTFPVIVLVYADQEDFASWHFYVDEWVAGQAFTAQGITTQIIPSYSDVSWIGDVIPHEIAHLFFYQVMDTPMATWPAWLSEGLAQYYEATDPTAALDRVEFAVREGTLLPLISLSGGFGRDPEQVRLSYDESLSVVIYILETWGDVGLQNLIEVFKEGENPRSGIESALDVTWEEFEAGWITWMGIPATPKPSPIPTSTFVFPTAPSGWPTPTKLIKETATDTPQATVPESSPTPPAGEVGEESGGLRSLCGGATIGSILLPSVVWITRRRKEDWSSTNVR